MQARIPILLAGAAAGVGALVLVRMVPVDASIPAGYAPVVEDARTSLLTNVDGAPGLRFERIECTADGGYVVWFHGGFPLGEDQMYIAQSAAPYAAGQWGGGVADNTGGPTGIEHAPIVACG